MWGSSCLAYKQPQTINNQILLFLLIKHKQPTNHTSNKQLDKETYHTLGRPFLSYYTIYYISFHDDTTFTYIIIRNLRHFQNLESQ